jgi:hypothetical protein
MSIFNKPTVNENAGMIRSSNGISESPEVLIRVAETIIKEHLAHGVESPLSEAIVAELSFKVKAVKDKHDQGMKYLKIANDLLIERDVELGTRTGMVSDGTTLKFYINCAAEILNRHLDGNQRSLNEWGLFSRS